MPAAQTTPNMQALRAKPAVVFVALLLAALQFTIATHQFNHTANEIGDVCSFCLQLDKLDDLDTRNDFEFAASKGASSDIVLAPVQLDARRQILPQPRAPPLS